MPGSNLLDVDPQLGPLAENGGPTATMALPISSPAVNRGAAFGLTTDQRGDPRPVAYPGIPISSAARRRLLRHRRLRAAGAVGEHPAGAASFMPPPPACALPAEGSPRFRAKLDAATSLVVREVETARGTTHSAYRVLRVLG